MNLTRLTITNLYVSSKSHLVCFPWISGLKSDFYISHIALQISVKISTFDSSIPTTNRSKNSKISQLICCEPWKKSSSIFLKILGTLMNWISMLPWRCARLSICKKTFLLSKSAHHRILAIGLRQIFPQTKQNTIFFITFHLLLKADSRDAHFILFFVNYSTLLNHEVGSH